MMYKKWTEGNPPPPPEKKKIPGQICSHVVHINALCISNN